MDSFRISSTGLRAAAACSAMLRSSTFTQCPSRTTHRPFTIKRIHRRIGNAEQEVAEQVGAIDRGGREVVHQRGGRPSRPVSMRPSSVPQILLHDLAVVQERRGIGLGAGHARIAGAQFLQMARGLELIPHPRRVAIRAQPHTALRGATVASRFAMPTALLQFDCGLWTTLTRRLRQHRPLGRGHVDAVRRERLARRARRTCRGAGPRRGRSGLRPRGRESRRPVTGSPPRRRAASGRPA